MQTMFGASDFKVTYEVKELGRQFTKVIKAMDSLDARRRFKSILDLEVIKVEHFVGNSGGS